ncbi:MAG: PCMD domain-containing protein [Tannerellaceae bacterium]|nr:PCMD domain-containing protein [Tannerellaceae bacterium]
MRRKRCYPAILCLLIASIGYLNAQINGDFENWVEDSRGNGALPGQYLRPGTQPAGWEASNVNQKVLIEKKETLVTPDGGRAGGASARMENKFVGVMTIGSNAPAYITLGVPWVYAVADLNACTGGTLGGVSYTGRPDSIAGYFKRSLGGEKAENALILAYLWEGTATSTVPVNPTGGFSSTETAEVQDQDISVLNSADGATLIGKAEYQISGELGDWTRIAIPFEYYGNRSPEKLNVIISSANYYDRGAIGNGNVLWADDVELVFKSTIKQTKLSIPDLPYECFYGRETTFIPTSNDTDTEIQISVEDPAIVTIENGIMKFLNVGHTRVTVRQVGNNIFTGAESTITVTVKPAPLLVSLCHTTTESDTEPVYSFIYEGLTDADWDIVQSKPEEVFETLPLAQAYTDKGEKVTFPAEPGIYTIKWLQKPVAYNYAVTTDDAYRTLTVTERATTGITEISEGVAIYTHQGKLYINSDKPVHAAVYTLQGSVRFQKNMAAGQTSVSLPKGLYIVKIDNKARKVVIH